jgi:hypothetical protein
MVNEPNPRHLLTLNLFSPNKPSLAVEIQRQKSKLNYTQTFATVKCSLRIKYLEMSLMYEAVQKQAMFHVGYFVTWNKRKVTR